MHISISVCVCMCVCVCLGSKDFSQFSFLFFLFDSCFFFWYFYLSTVLLNTFPFHRPLGEKKISYCFLLPCFLHKNIEKLTDSLI